MKTIQKILALSLLVLSTGFALWLYKNEPTAKIDPNDNAFQYALIDRTNTIWEYAKTTCPKTLVYPICHFSYLIDHWVPNWAEGYNLPYYYSHIPQITIVGSYRFLTNTHMLSSSVSLFQYYHVSIYLLLCSLPLVMFLAFRILSMPWLTSGLAALFALLISTDGLYGIDQTSFLWRGWGLSSQLFALIWLPLAVASAIRYTTETTRRQRNAWITIFFLTATTAGHLGIGMMAWMAVFVIAISPVLFQLFDKRSIKEMTKQLGTSVKHMGLLILPTCLLLSYWILPVFMGSAYHNTSVWDPVWKFNSFGAIEAITKLANGALFDFGRLPFMTILIIIGICVALLCTDDTKKQKQPLSLLFLFFTVLFFGRTTWGGLIDLIPGMSDFHGHRFIVGVHLAGLFLAPVGAMWIVETLKNYIVKKTKRHSGYLSIATYALLCVLSCILLLPHIISYARYNDTLLVEGNNTYEEAKPDMELLLHTLQTEETKNPGRVYALRGTEGSNFRIASSAYYMQLSTFGIPTVLWLPETWSPNSDTEQFFTEENPVHYNLYNIKYVVAPPDKKPQAFWKPIQKTSHWILYTVETNGYIDIGYSPSVVGSKKTDFINLMHLWIQSNNPANGLFPELQITDKVKNTDTLPHFQMTDALTYQTPDNKSHSLFEEPPIYQDAIKTVKPPMTITSQSSNHDMQFTVNLELTAPCPTCVVVLKQTYHPNWQVTMNGKKAPVIEVFPSYSAVRIEQPGTYTITFTYTPSPMKIILFLVGWMVIIAYFFLSFRK